MFSIRMQLFLLNTIETNEEKTTFRIYFSIQNLSNVVHEKEFITELRWLCVLPLTELVQVPRINECDTQSVNFARAENYSLPMNKITILFGLVVNFLDKNNRGC
jgi:hypothetical protein